MKETDRGLDGGYSTGTRRPKAPVIKFVSGRRKYLYFCSSSAIYHGSGTDLETQSRDGQLDMGVRQALGRTFFSLCGRMDLERLK